MQQPDDECFHFGYAAYEPMLNLIKGLLIAFVTLFALISAIGIAANGGRGIQGITPWVRMLETGRNIYLQLYLVLDEDFPDTGISGLDSLREQIYGEIVEDSSDTGVDIIFTRDAKWVGRTVNNR